MERVDYSGQTISTTDIVAKVESGKISIPMDVLKEKKMVRFEYEGHGVKVPLLTYVTSTGRVVTAVSICEPCRSTRFHIEGKSIVCNVCATGILIEEKAVLNWKPRV